MNVVLLVEDVICSMVPCHGTELVLQECNLMPSAYLDDEEVGVPAVQTHRLKVHEFRGGSFEGVRIAFTPAVEQALGLPLRTMSDQLHALERQIESLQRQLQAKTAEAAERVQTNTRLRLRLKECEHATFRLKDYEHATFRQRLRYLFTGRIA